MRVRQPGGGLGFAQEANSDLLAERQLGREDLDGHLALEPLVTGVEHHAHTTATELSLNGEGVSQRLDQSRGQRLVRLVHASSRGVGA